MNVDIKPLTATVAGMNTQVVEAWWLARSVVFYVLMVAFTTVFCSSALVWGPFLSPKQRFHWIIGVWTRVVVHSLRLICGVRWEIIGLDNVPSQPCILYSKHQSTWETFFLQVLFAPQSQVIKKELLAVPFFGWAFSLISPIAIDRSRRREALQQVVEQGTERLQDGYWVLIFPEGTRVSPGERREFSKGGAILSVRSGYPLLPIAHNAGLFWPNNRLIKKPGTIRVVIGQPIAPEGLTAEALTEKGEHWIQQTMEQL